MKEAIEEKDAALALLNDKLQDRDNQLALISHEMAKSQREISKLKQDTADLQVAVERLERHVVPHLEDARKDNGMEIIQKNNGDPEYSYIAICGQQDYVSQKIQHKMIDYPNA